MKNAIYLAIMWAMLPTGVAFAADSYGGDLSTKRNATGFFRLDEIDGRHFLITPQGHPFGTLGLNHFHMMKSRDYDRALQNLRDGDSIQDGVAG